MKCMRPIGPSRLGLGSFRLSFALLSSTKDTKGSARQPQRQRDNSCLFGDVSASSLLSPLHRQAETTPVRGGGGRSLGEGGKKNRRSDLKEVCSSSPPCTLFLIPLFQGQGLSLHSCRVPVTFSTNNFVIVVSLCTSVRCVVV